MSYDIKARILRENIGLISVVIHKRMFKMSTYITDLEANIQSLPCTVIYLKFTMEKIPIILNFMTKQKRLLSNVSKCAVICNTFPSIVRKKFTEWSGNIDSITDVRFFKTEYEMSDFFMK